MLLAAPSSSVPRSSLLPVQARAKQCLGERAPEPASCGSWYICVFSILCLPHLLCLLGSREWLGEEKRRRGGWASASTDHMVESLRISISSVHRSDCSHRSREASIPSGGWRGNVCKLGHHSMFLWAGHQALVCQVSEYEVGMI